MCKFLVEYVSLFDHVLTEEGIMVDIAKVGPIRDWVRPNSAIKIWSSLDGQAIIVGLPRFYLP